MEFVEAAVNYLWVFFSGPPEDVVTKTGGALYGASIVWRRLLTPLLISPLLVLLSHLLQRIKPKVSEDEVERRLLKKDILSKLNGQGVWTTPTKPDIHIRPSFTADDAKLSVDWVVIVNGTESKIEVKQLLVGDQIVTAADVGEVGWIEVCAAVREMVSAYNVQLATEKEQEESERRKAKAKTLRAQLATKS